MDLAYPGFAKKLTYPLIFEEVEPEHGALTLLELSWQFAQNGHGQRDLAVRLDDGKSSFFYSGDGAPTPETLVLARQCDLIVHEAFDVNDNTPGHSNIEKCIEFAREAGARSLALVHIQRGVRKKRYPEILRIVRKARDLRVTIPKPGEAIDL
ncbi:MAG: MBL fold metallo-hydrolase, partial [Desulfoferrobacter sp.]